MAADDASKSGEQPHTHTRPWTTPKCSENCSIAQLQRTTAMANSNGTAEVAKTPTKEQNVDGQADGAEEEGANGQMPDSMCH